MRRRRLISLFLLLAVVISTAGVLVFAPARHARAAVTEHISAYEVALTAENDGDLAVKETIAYDFGSNDRHGIYRNIPTSDYWDDTYHRIWKLADIKVTQDGKKAVVATDNSNGQKVIKVGDKNKTITGSHTYVISYVVEGAFLPPAGKDNPRNTIDLAWDAIGTEWSVPIDKATVTMSSPTATPVSCVRGDTGSTKTCQHNGATFTATGLAAGEGVTVDYGFPAGSISGLGPILRHNVTFAWFFTGSKVGIGAGVLALLAGLGALIAGWRRSGRDSSYVGQIPGLAPVAGQESAVQVGGTGGATSVAFTPPAGVRPAELAMLLNEKTDQRGVTATLIDLAVRGYLRIEEIDEGGHWRRKKPDHRLERSAKPADDLEMYERELLGGVFHGETSLLLSEQKNGFATISGETQTRIEKRSVELGWFPRKPSSTRTRWTVLGAVLLLGGLAAMIAGGQVGWGAAGLGIMVVGIVCLAMTRAMPARTALGSAVRADGLAFRRYLATAEADQIRFEEREEIFNRYLPFAIAFDLADHWVSTFQHALATVAGGAGNSMPYAGWYVGSGGFDNFNSGLSSFSSGMSSAMTSASSSGGGGGGVGGGGGGGGGGSW
ncbi:MAG TPA: DUF2207 domain-containing protein [Actinopolymorphaceae bacterium]|jgi:hypothetical protein